MTGYLERRYEVNTANARLFLESVAYGTNEKGHRKPTAFLNEYDELITSSICIRVDHLNRQSAAYNYRWQEFVVPEWLQTKFG